MIALPRNQMEEAAKDSTAGSWHSSLLSQSFSKDLEKGEVVEAGKAFHS